MDEARKVTFGEHPWTDDAPGICAREVVLGDAHWALVEYGESVGRVGLCYR